MKVVGIYTVLIYGKEREVELKRCYAVGGDFGIWRG